MIEKIVELTGHTGAIYTVDGTGNFVFTGAGDKYAAQWLLDEAKQGAFSIKADASIYALKLVNNDSQLVIGTSTGSLHCIDLINRVEIKHFLLGNKPLFTIAENRVRDHVYATNSDGELFVWRASTWEHLITLPFSCGKIRSLMVIENGDLLALACQNGKIVIIETNGFNELHSFNAHETGVNTLSLFPNKPHILISGGKDGYLRVWKWKEGKLVVELPAHNFGIYAIQFLNDGKFFVTTSRDKSIKLWDAENLNVLQKIERKHGGHSHAVNDLWKQSETKFVTVGDDKRIIYWEVK